MNLNVFTLDHMPADLPRFVDLIDPKRHLIACYVGFAGLLRKHLTNEQVLISSERSGIGAICASAE